MGVFICVSSGTGLQNSAVGLVVVLCNDLHIFQREVFLIRVEDSTHI